jgi:hypothetical protein
MEGGNIDAAQEQAERIAFSLLQDGGQKIRMATIESPSRALKQGERNIASITSTLTTPVEWSGKLGKDPWGNPFHFRFLKNKLGAPVQIVVWSDGPSKKAKEPVVLMSSSSGVEELDFDKSDVVVTKISVR